MTAKELIKILEQYPEDIEILLEYDGWYYRAKTVEKETCVIGFTENKEEDITGLVIE